MPIIRLFIRGYQMVISPVIAFLSGPGAGCRFEPTCSNYFLQACETHGVIRGSLLGIKRLARCQPWGGSGFDPVPDIKPADCTRKCTCANASSRPDRQSQQAIF